MIVSINEKNIQKKAKENNWKGDGSKENPFEIDNVKDSSSTLEIIDMDLFIVIKNCTWKKIIFIKCKNIMIKTCVSIILKLIKCQNMHIETCNVQKVMESQLCSNIIIQNNNIEKLIPFLCRELIISNNELGRKKNLQKKFLQRK